MTKLETIQKAIVDNASELSADDFAKLRAFLDELEADLWDAQIERDAAAGKFDKLIAKARAEHEAGTTVRLDGSQQHYFSAGFQRAFEKLPDDVQREAAKSFQLLESDPKNPALRFKKIGSA